MQQYDASLQIRSLAYVKINSTLELHLCAFLSCLVSNYVRKCLACRRASMRQIRLLLKTVSVHTDRVASCRNQIWPMHDIMAKCGRFDTLRKRASTRRRDAMRSV